MKTYRRIYTPFSKEMRWVEAYECKENNSIRINIVPGFGNYNAGYTVEYNGEHKGDFATLRRAKEAVERLFPSTPLTVAGKEVRLTEVQRSVMARFDRGERLVSIPTRRQSGDALFWVRQQEEGAWRVVEKALYPQLRQLFWNNLISDKNPEQMVKIGDISLQDCWELHYAGCIGY